MDQDPVWQCCSSSQCILALGWVRMVTFDSSLYTCVLFFCECGQDLGCLGPAMTCPPHLLLQVAYPLLLTSPLWSRDLPSPKSPVCRTRRGPCEAARRCPWLAHPPARPASPSQSSAGV